MKPHIAGWYVAEYTYVMSMLAFAVAPTLSQRGASACVSGGGHDHYPFCNRTLALEERVADLVRRIPNYSKAKLLTARARAALP